MQNIKQIKNLKGKKVLLRLDLNTPFENGKVSSDFKITQSLETIKFLVQKKAKVVIVSHLGRSGDSLAPVFDILAKKIKISFIKDKMGTDILKEKVSAMKDGGVVLLENIRLYKEEEENDKVFAKKLASLCDVYVNDAFAVSHRSHASIVGVAKWLPSYAGFQLENEIKNLSVALNPKHPFLVVMGGAKTETKIPLIEKYLKIADNVFVGGAIVNTFLKLKGIEIGKSVFDSKAKVSKSVLNNKKLILPDTVILENKDEIHINQITKNDKVLDIGVKSILEIESLIKKAKLILWNGPMGWYESGYKKGTIELSNLLMNTKAKVIIGGGDTALFFDKKKNVKNIFISTGGGATLEFLSKGTLPGIKVLK